jgi:hypothetical protein
MRSPGSVKTLACNTMDQAASNGSLTRQFILATGSSDCRCATNSQIGRRLASACQASRFYRRLAEHASPRSRSTRGVCLRKLCRWPFGLHSAHTIRRTSRDLSSNIDTCMVDRTQLAPLTKYLHQMLRRMGHPDGRLTQQGQKFGKETFQWEVSPGR